jgi:hypothetical protein
MAIEKVVTVFRLPKAVTLNQYTGERLFLEELDKIRPRNPLCNHREININPPETGMGTYKVDEYIAKDSRGVRVITAWLGKYFYRRDGEGVKEI